MNKTNNQKQTQKNNRLINIDLDLIKSKIQKIQNPNINLNAYSEAEQNLFIDFLVSWRIENENKAREILNDFYKIQNSEEKSKFEMLDFKNKLNDFRTIAKTKFILINQWNTNDTSKLEEDIKTNIELWNNFKYSSKFIPKAENNNINKDEFLSIFKKNIYKTRWILSFENDLDIIIGNNKKLENNNIIVVFWIIWPDLNILTIENKELKNIISTKFTLEEFKKFFFIFRFLDETQKNNFKNFLEKDFKNYIKWKINPFSNFHIIKTEMFNDLKK